MTNPSYNQVLIRLAMYEKLVLFGSVCLALLLTILGFYIAYKTLDYHWLNRAGSAIVAIEGVIAVLEFARRNRLETIHHFISKNRTNEEDKKNSPNSQFHKEARKSEFQVLFIATVLAVIGELLHGFGDLIISLIVGNADH